MFFENQLGNALFIGLVATLVMSTLMIIYRVSRRAPLNLPLLLGKFAYSNKKLSDKNAMRIGILLHLLVGSLWGAVYWFTVPIKTVFSGLLFSTIPWFLMMVLVLPILGQGFFGGKVSKYIPEVYLILHAIYGLMLGFLAAM